MPEVLMKGPVVFCAAVKPTGEWLLVERVSPPDIGSWSIPGGHIEKGESPFEACVRELYEETGAEVLPEYKGSVDIFTPAKGVVRRCVYFVSPWARGNIRGSSEGEAGWFRLEEKPISPFLTLLRPWLCGPALFRGFLLCGSKDVPNYSCILPNGTVDDLRYLV